MSKIGIICEGSIGGEDEQVISALAKRINPNVTLEIRPQGRKPNLVADSGSVAQSLFASGCDRVIIIWDIFPRWNKPDGEAQDTTEIKQVLALSNLDNHPRLYLVAIKAELEAWLLADGTGLSGAISTVSHPVIIGDTKNIEGNTNPKKRLEKVFKQHGKTYSPKYSAMKIVNNIPANFGTLEKVKSFRRFGAYLSIPCQI